MWPVLPLFALAVLLNLCSAAFVETFPIEGTPLSQFVLKDFVIDVGLDVDKKLLKFFINSVVSSPIADSNLSIFDPVITDVDYSTNRYTTFHVEIDFMGKTFILKNLRFCDLVAVKNTSAIEPTVRYPGSDSLLLASSSSSSTADSKPTDAHLPWNSFNTSSIARRNYFEPHLNSSESKIGLLATSNTSVADIYNNSTGKLVQCPLYLNDSIVMYYQADVKDHIDRLGSYSVKFAVVSNGPSSIIIGGTQAYVTPVLQPRVLTQVLFFGVLCLLLVTNFINYLITIFSPNQESSNPFLIEASTICNEKLLKQLVASVNRIVGYCQFALFMAGLDLQYPGFLQPLMGQIRWCALLGINILQLLTPLPLLESDNVYITLNSSGLGALALYSTSRFIFYSWPNFMACLAAWIAITMILYQGFILFRLLTRKISQKHPHFRGTLPRLADDHAIENNSVTFRFSASKNAWALVGHILRQFLHTFGVPFLVLTLFMLYTSSNMSIWRMHFSQDRLRIDAFNETLPYDMLVGRRPMGLDIRNEPQRKYNSHSVIPIGSVIGGCIALVAWFVLIAFFVFRYLLTVKNWKLLINPNLRKLYTSVKAVIVWSYFYNEYLPDRVIFAFVDIVYAILVLLVVGLLQKHGTVQVVLLIVIEISQLFLLTTMLPFYLEMTWHSLAWIIPVARFVVSVLSVPYIRALNVSEAARTYIAYAQMVIHLLVAFIFATHLFYCLALTGVAFFKALKERKQQNRYLGDIKGESVDDFNDDFEYQPIKSKLAPSAARVDGEKLLLPQTTGGDEEELSYYRANSEMILKRTQILEPAKDVHGNDDVDIESAELKVQHDQPKKDYTTREGDRIYNKFFSGGAIDPEIRDLWLSRDWNHETAHAAPQQSDDSPPKKSTGISKLLSMFQIKKEPVTRGFEVNRPRQIIIRPQNEVEVHLDLSSNLINRTLFNSSDSTN